ncbi:MAG: DNA polymerase III subunit alpha [Candidatus Omnitrophica bacterium]|nr:DNA polymerase III subunit alpha [Candidatus Omnitrophota bacterium]
MKPSKFVHLHGHTQYSLLDGACLLEELIKLAQAYEMNAIAMTDHGNMFGAIEFYLLCQKAGIKPIVGCECYLAPVSRFEKISHGISETAYHLILLSKDQQGYHNLMKLVSAGFLEGFYYKPRVDKELLAQHSQGLICSSSCLKGEIGHLILSDQIQDAYKAAGEYNEIFGKGNFYLEMQDHGLQEQLKINKALIQMSKDLNIPLVATNDFHYLQKSHSYAHEALLCIQTQTTLDDQNRMRFKTDEFYFKTADEMSMLFKETPSAITNTMEIADKCNLQLDLHQLHLPIFEPPEGKDKVVFLRELATEGMNKRYPNPDKIVLDRLEYELRTIEQSHFISYFLIVWDLIRHAREHGIPVGPGRGSAAGSLISYCLGITQLDPLKYNLIFERFLNPERITMPDIDIDFCYERRDEVINYVISKYGKDNVAQIITFGTMLAKGVIRDVARVMGFTYAESDKIAKLVPTDLNIKLSQALQQEPELMDIYKSDKRVTKLFDTAFVLEGLTRHASTHAAGVVISQKPLVNYLPMFKTGDGQITTGYPMGSLEAVGLLKMDFLGLRTLTVVNETIKIIKRTKSIDVDIENLSLNDNKTYEFLSNAKSIGVFQLESRGMRDLLKKLRPTEFEDIVALLALYRPGPIGSGMVDDFIKRKHGHTHVKYDHPLLESILKPTYGIILYQEQIMQIVNKLAGFSMSQADTLRRAISKKTPEVIQKQRKLFVEGCAKNSINTNIADKIFSLIEYFSGYGFNRSHSAAYAIISYRTAYLKANYPLEFMAALLTSERDNTDKVVLYIDEAKSMGIEVLPPDINESYAHFTVVGERNIRFGLTAVKNVGQLAVDSIVEARKNHGKFNTLYDFCEHVDLRLVNRKVIESLIKCGAMSSFGLHRSQMISMVDHALEVADVLQKDRDSGQLSFFDDFETDDKFKKEFQKVPDIKEWPSSQLLAFEKELLGFYITGHPLAVYEKTLKMLSKHNSASLGELTDGEEVSLGGIITKARFTFTKKTGEKMAIIILEDLKGSVETLVFPRAFKLSGKFVVEDAIIFVKGTLNLREDTPKIIVEEILPIDDAKKKYVHAVSVELRTSGLEKKTLQDLNEILKKYKGTTPVYLNFITQDKRKFQISTGKDITVVPTDDLIEEIEKLLGQGTVRMWV